MKNRFLGICRLGLAALAVALMFSVVLSSEVYSGGGINWKVTVQNPTEYKVRVWVWVRQLSLSEKYGSKTVISAGGSKTWETGAKCPSAIEGEIYVDGKWLKMKEMDCLGGDHNHGTAVSTTCCWNISARVCQKTGHGYT